MQQPAGYQSTNQTNKMAANDGQQFFNANTGNGINIFDAGELKVTWAVPEKHKINFFGLMYDYFMCP